MPKVIVVEVKPGVAHRVYYENGVFIGEILMKEDGFYDFWPELKGGCWPSYMLRVIADRLDEMNADWEKNINDYFENRDKEIMV